MDREKAFEILKKYLKEENNILHSLEGEAVLRGIAKELGEDENIWGIAGLLHDLDWELTESNPELHGIKAVEILKEENFEIPENVSHAIMSHNEEFTKIKRESILDFSLAAGESVTGLIYAYALMRGGKISDMTAKGLKKKLKDKTFAAGCDRNIIKEAENLGLSLEEFFEIAIEAIKNIKDDIGLS